MRQLILDHFRRWGLVLVLCAVLEFWLGWFIATGPKLFEFWALVLAMWAGSTLLSFDLKKGILRTVAMLPLTGPQIGRAWWLATVGIPGAALTLMLIAGATTYYCLHPNRPIAIGDYVFTSLFTLAWLGMSFALPFMATLGFGDTRKEMFRIGLISWGAQLAYFGSMLLCNGAAKSPFRATLILGAGALFTVLGWRRANEFEPARASLYLGRIEVPVWKRSKVGGGPQLTPLKLKTAPELSRAPLGYGGLPFLLKTTGRRMFVAGLATSVLILLLLHWQGQMQTEAGGQLGIRMALIMAAWLILFSQYTPLVQHLRFLRTLPISTARLALTMLALVLLPMLATSAVLTVVAQLALGPSVSIVALQVATFLLIPAVICAVIAVWLGSGKLGLLVSFMIVLGSVGQAFLKPVSLSRISLIALATILVAFVLIRHTLSHSSRPYST